MRFRFGLLHSLLRRPEEIADDSKPNLPLATDAGLQAARTIRV